MGAFFGRFCMGIQVRQYPGLFVRKEGLQSYFSRLIRLIVNSPQAFMNVSDGLSTAHQRGTVLCLSALLSVFLAYSVVFHHSIAVFSGSGLCYSLCDMWRHPYKSLPVFPFFLLHASFFCLTSHLCSQWMPLHIIAISDLWFSRFILVMLIPITYITLVIEFLHTLQLFDLIHVVVVRVLLLKV